MSLSEQGRLERARLLLPAVELALETGDRAGAETLAAELDATATYYGTPGLLPAPRRPAPLLAVAAGRPADAIADLESGRGGLPRPALPARGRHRSTSSWPWPTARSAHTTAPTPPRRRRWRSTSGSAHAPTSTGSRRAPCRVGSPHREAEVLACVVSGASNREVRRQLVISDKTVSRHLANIFAKAGVSSRTAAAAWAREHGL